MPSSKNRSARAGELRPIRNTWTPGGRPDARRTSVAGRSNRSPRRWPRYPENRLPMGAPATQPASRPSGSSTVVASLAALGSVLAASTCCLPLLPFVMAAGLAGSSTFLDAVRPYLLAASLLLIAFGFYQARRAKKCQRRHSL